MAKGQGHFSDLEHHVWRLIMALDADLKRIRQSKSVASVVVLSNKEYKAEFSFLGDNIWSLDSPTRSYKIKDPSLDYLLEKYARLQDQNFNNMIGDQSLYDTTEDYVKASQRYVQSHRGEFLRGLIFCLKKAQRKLF